jgi:hypothetical protein
MNPVRSLVAALVLCGFLLLSAASFAAVPKPPPMFWGASRCERTLHLYGDREGGLTTEGNGFHVGAAVCVGTGGPAACRWTSGHRSRLYSQFVVFTRSRYVGGVVRSFTLATRGGPGLVRYAHHAGDQYVGWPADYYMSPASVRLLATHVTPARFRSLVAPLVAHLQHLESATRCTGG